MQNETTVVITIEGVRANRIPRLMTVVKSNLQTFGRKTTVKEVESGKEARDGKQAVAKPHGKGKPDR